jgi:hypothetical protein
MWHRNVTHFLAAFGNDRVHLVDVDRWVCATRRWLCDMSHWWTAMWHFGGTHFWLSSVVVGSTLLTWINKHVPCGTDTMTWPNLVLPCGIFINRLEFKFSSFYVPRLYPCVSLSSICTQSVPWTNYNFFYLIFSFDFIVIAPFVRNS